MGSANYLYLATPEQSIESLISIIAIAQQKFANNIQNSVNYNDNDTVKRSAQIVFFSMGTVVLFFSFVWYLVLIEFDVAKLLVAFINNIVNIGCMAGIELLFLYICAPNFIPLYPAFVDTFVLAIVRYVYCFDLPQNPNYYDFLLYIYFMNLFFFGNTNLQNSLLNNQNLQNYVLQNPQSLSSAANSANETGFLAQLPRRNTNNTPTSSKPLFSKLNSKDTMKNIFNLG